MTFKLTDHHFARAGEQLPPVDESMLLDYVCASNGAFARGRRPGLEVCMPVSFNLQPMRGLREIESYVQWGYPRIPQGLIKTILSMSRGVCVNSPLEALFHLSFGDVHTCANHIRCESGWHVEWPEQEATDESVKPTHSGVGTSTDRALIELHSHHGMRAEFSQQDNEAESQGFRIYAVIGTIFDRPRIRARVGLFGHFYEIAATEFFALPEELTDCIG